MICCVECFRDPEIRASIERLEHKGNCPVCGSEGIYIYDSETDMDETDFEELLRKIVSIYVPESLLSDGYPENKLLPIEKALMNDWNLFQNNLDWIREIVNGLIDNALTLDSLLKVERVGIPQLNDDAYLNEHCFMKSFTWLEFKKYLRNVNRFHTNHINKDVLAEILEDAEIRIPKGTIFYRARVSNERGNRGFSPKEMGAPPADIATPGRANSKGQSCLYLSSNLVTTVKEIRAHVFDYVTIAKFKVKEDLRILDLSSLTHQSPFQVKTDKVDYIVNENILSEIERDMAKPLSRWDSDLDYLPTQYISDFAKYLGYEGVKYYSTFDREAYNVAIFEPSMCKYISKNNYFIENLDYKLEKV